MAVCRTAGGLRADGHGQSLDGKRPAAPRAVDIPGHLSFLEVFHHLAHHSLALTPRSLSLPPTRVMPQRIRLGRHHVLERSRVVARCHARTGIHKMLEKEDNNILKKIDQTRRMADKIQRN